MDKQILYNRCVAYMDKLCSDISERCVGSEGNKQSTEYFEKILSSFGWSTYLQEFKAIDWYNGGSSLKIDDQDFKVFASPYSLGFDGTGQLAGASRISELKNSELREKILLLYGEIAKEQLMPKNFVFYNPEEHKQIISWLENSKAKAIISATGRNPSLAGGIYPFPLIEDGDFNIPSVYMTEEEGIRLISYIGKQATLKSVSKRIPSNGCNVIGNIGKEGSGRIVITAHIDAKKGSPGATDNATGVAVLLILAELLKDYSGNKQIEIVALNGEDYYAASGQMNYIKENRGNFNNILLNINIDGAGYKEGKTTFSFFDLSEEFLQKAIKTINGFSNITEGIKWPQGDHSIFLQYGRPAIAISSQWFTENSESQDITHTSKDNLEIVDFAKVIEIAEVLNVFVRTL